MGPFLNWIERIIRRSEKDKNAGQFPRLTVVFPKQYYCTHAIGGSQVINMITFRVQILPPPSVGRNSFPETDVDCCFINKSSKR